LFVQTQARRAPEVHPLPEPTTERLKKWSASHRSQCFKESGIMEITVRADFEQPSQNGVFPLPDGGKSKLKTDTHFATGAGLELSVRHAADVVIVDLHGKATIGRANDFLDGQLRQLIELGTSKMLVNLTDATQLDSSSIGSIVRAFTSLKRRGASLKLLAPRGNVRLVLEAVHLQELIPTIEDETEAIASFKPKSERGAVMTDPQVTVPTVEEIELRAYEIYLKRGDGDGVALEDWLAAERELLASRKTDAVGPSVKRKAAS
jgi:anti-sigma B factor antagonist